MFRSANFVKVHREDGKEPVREFKPKERKDKCTRDPTEEGMEPVKRLVKKSSWINFVKVHREEGNEPDRELKAKERKNKFTRDPTQKGDNEPVRELELKARNDKCTRDPIEEGMGPAKRLE